MSMRLKTGGLGNRQGKNQESNSKKKELIGINVFATPRKARSL